jgi:hypothetical protein
MAKLDSPVDPRWAKFIVDHKVPPKEDGSNFTFDESDAIMNRNLKDGQLPGPEGTLPSLIAYYSKM